MLKNDFSISVKTSKNNHEKINITSFGDKDNHTKCLICVHGLKGFKDWGFFPTIGNYFAEKGYYVITFNFSHNGIGEINDSFTELERFAENTHSLELEELNCVIDYYVKSQKSLAGKSIFLLGHSRGGGVAILSGYSNQNVDKIVSWAGVANFDRYSTRAKKEWNEKGYMEIINSRTNQIMRMNNTLLKDIIENGHEKLNIVNAVKYLNKPLLLVYAQNDLAVKPKEGRLLFDNSNKVISFFYEIENTGHTFDVEHPNKKNSEVLEKIIKFTFEFLENSSEKEESFHKEKSITLGRQ